MERADRLLTRREEMRKTIAVQLFTVFALLISALLAITLTAPALGEDNDYIAVYSARLGPVIHEVKDGVRVEVWAEITYPGLLGLAKSGPFLLPPLSARVYCNWTAWGASITIGVLGDRYDVDPTTLKPVTWSYRLASGGCILGPGSSIYASTPPITNTSATCQVKLAFTTRLADMLSTASNVKGYYFFRVSLALYDPETGSVVPGGYVYLYTSGVDAPSVLLSKSRLSVSYRNGEQVAVLESSSENSPIIGLTLLVLVTGAVFAAAVYYLSSRRHNP